MAIDIAKIAAKLNTRQISAMSSGQKSLDNSSEKEQIDAVRQDGWVIEHITNPSELVQLAAVKHQGFVIQLINNPSERVQLAAVRQDGNAVSLISNPSERVQLAAVGQHGIAIRYITNPSERVQLAAVRQDKIAIKHIGPRLAMHFLHSRLGAGRRDRARRGLAQLLHRKQATKGAQHVHD